MLDSEKEIFEKEIFEKYRLIDDKLFMSVDEAEILSRGLAEMVMADGIKVDKVIGIANGAILPATVIAEYMSLPLEMERIRRKGSGLKRKLAKVPFLLGLITAMYKLPISRDVLRFVMNKFNRLEENESQQQSDDQEELTVLVIDDAVETGQTLKRIMEMQLDVNPATTIYTAVISWSVAFEKPVSGAVEPDFFISKRIQHYPWSQNSNHFSDYQKWLKDRDLQEWE